MLFPIYIFSIEEPLKTKKYVDEILTLKIDSCHMIKYDNVTTYEFFISNKYRAVIDSVHPVPFKTLERVDFYVKNIKGEYIVSDWKSSYWQKDADKLMIHFKNYLKNYDKK